MQSTSETTLIYALGAVQNICSIDVDFARECQGQHPILEWLKASSPPPQNLDPSYDCYYRILV